jgi:hypothetical protein
LSEARQFLLRFQRSRIPIWIPSILDRGESEREEIVEEGGVHCERGEVESNKIVKCAVVAGEVGNR